MNRRKILVDTFAQAITHHDWEACSECCFKLLYGIPFELQIELSCVMMQRYVRIFETRYPDMHWPQEILDAPTRIVDIFDYAIPPDEPEEEFGPADAAFWSGFDALCGAYYYRGHQAVVTAACACAVDAAIAARVDNVWQADDPEAVDLWKQRRIPHSRTTFENAACIAVGEREWKEVLGWFQRKAIWTYPDTVDIEEMEQALDCWNEGEKTLLSPYHFMEEHYRNTLRTLMRHYSLESRDSEREEIEDLVRAGGISFEAVVHLLHDNETDRRIRRIACQVLGQLGDQRAVEPLLSIIQAEYEPAEVRSHAAEALGLLGDPCAVPPLINALHDPSPDVRFWAASALGALRDPRALSELEHLAATDETTIPGRRSVKHEAIHAMKRIQGRE